MICFSIFSMANTFSRFPYFVVNYYWIRLDPHVVAIQRALCSLGFVSSSYYVWNEVFQGLNLVCVFLVFVF